VHDIAIHIGQAKIPPRVPIRQFFVVKSEQMQRRRVEIVNGDLFLDHLEAELIGCAINHPGLHATASQPHREAARIVIPAIALLEASRPKASS
jgi:hypothetical protein